MSESYYKRTYRGPTRENKTEFLFENLAYFASEPIVHKFFKENYKHTWRDYAIPPIYYGTKEFLIPKLTKVVVYFLAESALGRWILKKLVKLERNKVTQIIFNIGLILSICKVLNVKADIVQIVQLLTFEIGSDCVEDMI